MATADRVAVGSLWLSTGLLWTAKVTAGKRSEWIGCGWDCGCGSIVDGGRNGMGWIGLTAGVAGEWNGMGWLQLRTAAQHYRGLVVICCS
jgi:hypothetical protein